MSVRIKGASFLPGDSADPVGGEEARSPPPVKSASQVRTSADPDAVLHQPVRHLADRLFQSAPDEIHIILGNDEGR